MRSQQEGWETIKRDLMALGQLVKGSETQVVFPSALPDAENDGQETGKSFR